ncbi:MAG: thiamine phosphate synthase, partial [Acidobacteriaceae bacterium]|nr:thiamine phosphate synthase [Acidobacteriaceae bacterium]
AQGGADLFQVREPHLDARALATLVADLVTAARGSAMRVLVNDRVDVALAACADGVHLKEQSVDAATVRRFVPRGFVIGVSVHDRAAVRRVGRDADYLTAGTVWPSASKPEGRPTLGVDGLAELVAAADVPVLGIGGVSFDRLTPLARTGAAGVAAISLFGLLPGGASEEDALAERIVAVRRAFDDTERIV